MNIIRRQIPTTNYDTSRKKIDRIVIHWFGIGTLTSADARFSKLNEQSSAHYGISDNTIYQWVDEAHTAYHSGNYSMNQRSVGIEHDATTTKNASDATYKTSGELVRAISDRHGIPLDREHIIAHREVKATQCPGTLDLDKIIQIAKDDIIPPVNDDTKKALKVLEATKVEFNHGNLEGTADAGRGAQKDAESLRSQIKTLQEANTNLTTSNTEKTSELLRLGEENKTLKTQIEKLNQSQKPVFTKRIPQLLLELAYAFEG